MTELRIKWAVIVAAVLIAGVLVFNAFARRYEVSCFASQGSGLV